MAMVREREIGTMEQLMVTPIRPVELILGKTLPFALIGLVDVLLVTVVGAALVSHPLRGSVLLLLFGVGPVPDDHARRGAVHLDDLPYAAAGHDVLVLLLLPGRHAVRLHVPDLEHARAVQWLTYPESAALLPGDRPRDLPEGQRHRDAVAAVRRAGGARRAVADLELNALPEAPG